MLNCNMKVFRCHIILFCFVAWSCQNESSIANFNVEISEFDSSYGEVKYYKINKDSLKIHYDCDMRGCKDTLLYAVKLNKHKLINFYDYLKTNPLDTLKTKYISKGFDGLLLRVKISGDSIESKSIRLERYWHSEVEKLITEMDKLIPDVQYKFLQK